MRKRHHRLAIMVLVQALALALTMTSVFAAPAMTETYSGGGSIDLKEQSVLDQDPSQGQEQQLTDNSGQDRTQGQDQDKENETNAETGKEKKELTPKEKEAEAIAKYGTYKGKNARRIPVITYHRVVTDKEKRKNGRYRGSSLAISKSNFDKQMKWLHENGYRSISCEEFWLWHRGKIKLPKKTVLITFDDGFIGVADNALPVLKKYDMKGTSFIIGSSTRKNRKRSISYKRLRKIQETYPDLEFQSHTYALHKFYSSRGDYRKVLRDAEKQKKIYGFEYLAYPFGRYTGGMIRAYKESGIKMAFTYGKNGYATRLQNRYKIRRIKIYGDGSMAAFRKWFR